MLDLLKCLRHIQGVRTLEPPDIAALIASYSGRGLLDAFRALLDAADEECDAPADAVIALLLQELNEINAAFDRLVPQIHDMEDPSNGTGAFRLDDVAHGNIHYLAHLYRSMETTLRGASSESADADTTVDGLERVISHISATTLGSWGIAELHRLDPDAQSREVQDVVRTMSDLRPALETLRWIFSPQDERAQAEPAFDFERVSDAVRETATLADRPLLDEGQAGRLADGIDAHTRSGVCHLNSVYTDLPTDRESRLSEGSLGLVYRSPGFLATCARDAAKQNSGHAELVMPALGGLYQGLAQLDRRDVEGGLWLTIDCAPGDNCTMRFDVAPDVEPAFRPLTPGTYPGVRIVLCSGEQRLREFSLESPQAAGA